MSRAERGKRVKNIFPWVVLLPILGWYLLFVFYPAGKAFYMSLFFWNAENPILSRFVGLANYIDLIHDPRFITSLTNTLKYVILRTLISVPLSLFVAVLLGEIKRRNFYLFCIFLPVIMSAAALGVLWRWIYQPTFGLFNYILKSAGLPKQGFLNDPDQALYSIIGMDIWKNIGFGTVIFLADLMNIPETFYDAAKIDGASGWQTFWKVTLPLLGNTLLFMYVITMIGAFQIFDLILVMTQPTAGGPGRSTYVLSLLVYDEGLFRVRMGYATAVSMILFVLVMTVTLIQLKLLKPRWSY